MANPTVQEIQSKNTVKVQSAGPVSLQVDHNSGEQMDRKNNQRLETPTRPSSNATDSFSSDERFKISLAIVGISAAIFLCLIMAAIKAKEAPSSLSKSFSLHSTTTESFSTVQPTDLRFTIYKKYHDEPKHVEKMEMTSLQEIRSLLKPLEILWTKSDKAYHKADVESKRCWSEFMDKPGLWSFRDEFYGEMTKAWSTFNELMVEAKKNLNSKLNISEQWRIVEAEITDCRKGYEKKVNEVWQTFNQNVRNKTDIRIAASKFDQRVDRLRQDFATKAIVVRGIFKNKTKSAKDHFLKGEFDSALVDYDVAVKEAVEEFKWMASSALLYFTLEKG